METIENMRITYESLVNKNPNPFTVPANLEWFIDTIQYSWDFETHSDVKIYRTYVMAHGDISTEHILLRLIEEIKSEKITDMNDVKNKFEMEMLLFNEVEALRKVFIVGGKHEYVQS